MEMRVIIQGEVWEIANQWCAGICMGLGKSRFLKVTKRFLEELGTDFNQSLRHFKATKSHYIFTEHARKSFFPIESIADGFVTVPLRPIMFGAIIKPDGLSSNTRKFKVRRFAEQSVASGLSRSGGLIRP